MTDRFFTDEAREARRTTRTRRTSRGPTTGSFSEDAAARRRERRIAAALIDAGIDEDTAAMAAVDAVAAEEEEREAVEEAPQESSPDTGGSGTGGAGGGGGPEEDTPEPEPAPEPTPTPEPGSEPPADDDVPDVVLPPDDGDLFDTPAPVDDTIIPAGSKLIQVTNPAGSDADSLWILEYEYAGVRMQWEIGDTAEFRERFPSGANAFPAYETMGQRAFDNRDGLNMGFADEIYGATESLGSIIERGVREAGWEDIPGWMRNDPATLAVLFQGVNEGWSEGRILNTMRQTEGFKQRFPWIDTIEEQIGGGNLQDVIDVGVQAEQDIRQAIRRYRGPDADTSNEYIAQVIEQGWTPGEAAEVLEGEFRLRTQPEALNNLNEILAFKGIEPVGEDVFLELVTGRAAPDVVETVNDALRSAALEAEGIDLAPSLADALGDGQSLDLLDSATLAPGAQEAARNIFRVGLEVDAEKFGIDRRSIISAAFGEGPTQEVNARLAQFARERQAAAAGLGGFSTFQDQRGRLRSRQSGPHFLRLRKRRSPLGGRGQKLETGHRLGGKRRPADRH